MNYVEMKLLGLSIIENMAMYSRHLCINAIFPGAKKIVDRLEYGS